MYGIETVFALGFEEKLSKFTKNISGEAVFSITTI
jgi:hypothetical protein